MALSASETTATSSVCLRTRQDQGLLNLPFSGAAVTRPLNAVKMDAQLISPVLCTIGPVQVLPVLCRNTPVLDSDFVQRGVKSHQVVLRGLQGSIRS